MLRLVTKVVRLEDTAHGTKVTEIVSLGSTEFPEHKANSPGTRLKAINQLDNLFQVMSGINLTDVPAKSTLQELIKELNCLTVPYEVVKLPNEFRIIFKGSDE